jgi:tetratricopeptide (TPR) repeat protein
MSPSAVSRFKGREVDPKTLASTQSHAILLGKIISRLSELTISVELVEGETGWLMWSDSFDLKLNEILEIEDEIARQISFSLRLNVTGEEERRITARYTDSSDAYQAYLEGRFHWSRFTRSEIETAIAHFRRAIELDPNYALAYSGIIDCYLRLATNYLPPENDAGLNPDPLEAGVRIECQAPLTDESSYEPDQRLKLRHEWDWKGAERELRRARDLKTEYPAAHQWHAAYLFVRQLYLNQGPSPESSSRFANESLPLQIRSTRLTPSEEVQVFCTIAREQIVVGNFEGARLAIERWLPKSGWPKLDHLEPHTAADLLFTLGSLIGALSLIGRISRGIKRAETYLSGSISLLEQLGSKISAAEARIELARCYYREGLFDESREVLGVALLDLPTDQTELKSLCLSIYGCLDRDSGRLTESLARLRDASLIETGQLVTGFRHLQLATTLKELAISEAREDYYEEAINHFEQALYEFEAIGNHTNTAATENNFGYLLLSLGQFKESEAHLQRALNLFKCFSNDLRMAQVNETLSQLYLAMQDLPRAQEAIEKAVEALETTDGDAVLAEALITKGVISCRMKRYVEGRTSLESGYRVAERRGDSDSAVRAVVTLFEEIGDQLSNEETVELSSRLRRLSPRIQHVQLLRRLEQALAGITA